MKNKFLDIRIYTEEEKNGDITTYIKEGNNPPEKLDFNFNIEEVRKSKPYFNIAPLDEMYHLLRTEALIHLTHNTDFFTLDDLQELINRNYNERKKSINRRIPTNPGKQPT